MITVDWLNKIVQSDASIVDLPIFKESIRVLEGSEEGMMYPPIVTYKKVDLGGGAYFHAVDFINGYQLKFLGSGPYSILGNLNCTIVATGVQVERTKASAFATSNADGGSVPITIDVDAIATAVWNKILPA